ncbi:MAG: hypothetical protein EOP86_09985, partial [Verrucomicrobiaceae bacterium]
MNLAKKLTLLAAPSLLAVFAFADGLTPDSGAGAVQKEYEKEQARIDLDISRIRLAAAEGRITMDEAQTKIDRWVRGNGKRLRTQEERAAWLDSVDPLPPEKSQEPPAQEAAVAEEDNPLAVRLAELSQAFQSKMEELRSHAESPEKLQTLVDIWSRTPEGSSLLQEKADIEREQGRLKPLGTQPVVLEVDENAPPSAVAALEFQARVARRIMNIRESFP